MNYFKGTINFQPVFKKVYFIDYSFDLEPKLGTKYEKFYDLKPFRCHAQVNVRSAHKQNNLNNVEISVNAIVAVIKTNQLEVKLDTKQLI